MDKQRITLGQLINVLLESGINLNEIILTENQTQEIQDALLPVQVTRIAEFTQSEINKLPDDFLDNVAGGLEEETKQEIKSKITTVGRYIGKAIEYGVLTVGALHLTAGVIGLIKPGWGYSCFRFGPLGVGVGAGVTDNGRLQIDAGAYHRVHLNRAPKSN